MFVSLLRLKKIISFWSPPARIFDSEYEKLLRMRSTITFDRRQTRATFQCRLHVGCRCLTLFSTGTIVFCEKDAKFTSSVVCRVYH